MAFCCGGLNKIAPWTRAQRVPRRVPKLHRQQQRSLDDTPRCTGSCADASVPGGRWCRPKARRRTGADTELTWSDERAAARGTPLAARTSTRLGWRPASHRDLKAEFATRGPASERTTAGGLGLQGTHSPPNDRSRSERRLGVEEGVRLEPSFRKAPKRTPIAFREVVVSTNGWRSAAADQINLRAGHERSECLRAYRGSAASCNAR